MKINLANEDFIWTNKKEFETIECLIKACAILKIVEGREEFSMTRLIRKTFEIRTAPHITDTKIRRLILMLVAMRPKLLHIRQEARYRLMSPSEYMIKKIKWFNMSKQQLNELNKQIIPSSFIENIDYNKKEVNDITVFSDT